MKTNIITLFVSTLFIFTCLSFVSGKHVSNEEKFIIVLDAGHGGKDPGKNSKYGYKEKDIALKIVLKIGSELAKNPNIKVIYTRKTDVFIELRDRAKIANKAKADLFVSIHCNAHNTQAYGTETYVLDVGNTNRNFEVAKAENEVIFFEDDYEKHYEGFDPNSPESLIGVTLAQEEYTDQSILLADLIEKNFTKKLKRKSRGVKQASLWVIHQTAMPSVLIETGFVTNKTEGAYLNSKKGQQQISTSITNAILEYKASLYDSTDEFDIDTSNTPTVSNSSETAIYKDIIFKVQIAAGTKKLEPKSYNFKKLSPISRTKIGKLYKYFYDATSDYNEAKKNVETAKSKGYKSSFITAYKNGKKIPLTDALKTTLK